MRKKIGIISVFIVISIITMIPKSYGALTSKPTTLTDGSNVLVNKTVSQSYTLCRQMTSNGESLYGTDVEPHLATNKDWGAVSYLSNSVYGTNKAGQNKGVEITINSVKYNSTTGNASGVMNWGSNPNKSLYTFSSGLDNAYTGNNITSIQELYNNRTTEYVEYQDMTNRNLTIGMAIHETSSFYSGLHYIEHSNTQNNHVVVRNGLFGYANSTGNVPGTSGNASDKATFRPVIWN